MEYKKHYVSLAERFNAFCNFKESQKIITKHNEEFKLGKTTFEMGHNEFSDISMSEFSKMKGRSVTNNNKNTTSNHKRIVKRYVIPKSADWRPYCNEIQSQGDCGSCWAFSGVAAIETSYHIKHNITDPKNKIKLSEQQMIDCDGAYGANGCKGGLGIQVFEAVKNKGITLSKHWPYEMKQNVCLISTTFFLKINSFGQGINGDENQLKYYVSLRPVSVGIYSSLQSLRYFKGDGIYYDVSCTKNMDHEVLIVGYGSDSNGLDYWIIRNSWGTSWGQNGYFKLARNAGNHCGVASDPSFPIL